MRLWLVRHARPLVEEGLCYGALDVPAAESETAAAARQLAGVLPQAVHVLCSPLRRCTQLAQALAALRPDLKPQPDPRLAEMDFGAWEGRRWDVIDRRDLDAWVNDFATYRVGGHGQSVSQFALQVGQVLDESRAAGRDQVWIAHGGVFKAVLHHQSAMPLSAAADWPLQSLGWGQWHLFNIAGG